MKAALRFLEKAGATIVQMGQLDESADAGRPPAPPNRFRRRPNHLRGLAAGHRLGTPSCSRKAFRSSPRSTSAARRRRCRTCVRPQRVRRGSGSPAVRRRNRAHRDYRQITRPGGAKVDGRGECRCRRVSGAAERHQPQRWRRRGRGKVAFGRRDTPSAGNGSPTIVIPAGANKHGQPINIQLLGRAWDDAKLVGFAYAFERPRQRGWQRPRSRDDGAAVATGSRRR